ncbi:hypothetical protein D1872_125320 [compost metagenome]
MSQLTIICEQQQSFGVFIKTANGEYFERKKFRVQQIDHGLFHDILRSRDDALRLIHHYVYKFSIANNFSENLHFLRIRVNVRATVFDRFSVYFYRSALAQFLNFLA